MQSGSANNNTANLTPSPARLSTVTVCFLSICKQRGTEVLSFKVKQKSPFLAQPFTHRHTRADGRTCLRNTSPGVPLSPSLVACPPPHAGYADALAQAEGARPCDGAAARVVPHVLPFWQCNAWCCTSGWRRSHVQTQTRGMQQGFILHAGQDGERNPTAPQQDEHVRPPTPIQTSNASSIIIHPCSMYNRRVYKSFETHWQKLSLQH